MTMNALSFHNYSCMPCTACYYLLTTLDFGIAWSLEPCPVLLLWEPQWLPLLVHPVIIKWSFSYLFPLVPRSSYTPSCMVLPLSAVSNAIVWPSINRFDTLLNCCTVLCMPMPYLSEGDVACCNWVSRASKTLFDLVSEEHLQPQVIWLLQVAYHGYLLSYPLLLNDHDAYTPIVSFQVETFYCGTPMVSTVCCYYPPSSWINLS